MSAEPQLRRVVHVDDLLLHRNLFAIRGEYGASDDAAEPLSPDSGLVVGSTSGPIAFGAFWIELWSPCDGHFPSIRFESWDARPPPVSTATWESTVEGTIRVHEGAHFLQVVTMGFHDQSFPVDGEVQQVRVSVSGQATLPQRKADHGNAHVIETASDLARDLERWLIQVWPG